MRDLVKRLGKEGDGGILHRLRGRGAKGRIAEAVREKVVRLVKREYRDFGPTLAPVVRHKVYKGVKKERAAENS